MTYNIVYMEGSKSQYKNEPLMDVIIKSEISADVVFLIFTKKNNISVESPTYCFACNGLQFCPGNDCLEGDGA